MAPPPAPGRYPMDHLRFEETAIDRLDMPGGPTGDFNDRLSEDRKVIDEVGKHPPANYEFDHDEAYMTFVNNEKEKLQSRRTYQDDGPTPQKENVTPLDMSSIHGSAQKHPPMFNHANLPPHTECNPNYINPEDKYM